MALLGIHIWNFSPFSDKLDIKLRLAHPPFGSGFTNYNIASSIKMSRNKIVELGDVGDWIQAYLFWREDSNGDQWRMQGLSDSNRRYILVDFAQQHDHDLGIDYEVFEMITSPTLRTHEKEAR